MELFYIMLQLKLEDFSLQLKELLFQVAQVVTQAQQDLLFQLVVQLFWDFHLQVPHLDLVVVQW